MKIWFKTFIFAKVKKKKKFEGKNKTARKLKKGFDYAGDYYREPA